MNYRLVDQWGEPYILYGPEVIQTRRGECFRADYLHVHTGERGNGDFSIPKAESIQPELEIAEAA